MAEEFEMDDTIILIDEDNVEHEFEVEAFLEVDNEKYAVLVPLREGFDDEATIMRFGKDENGDDILFDIEDDEEWDKVADAYDMMIEEDN